MIIETVLRVVLHCSRCNTLFVDDDDRPVQWNNTELVGIFLRDMEPQSDVCGWMRVGDRVLCPDCWHTDEERAVEKPPLPAGDAHKVTLVQSTYAPFERVRAAFAEASVVEPVDGWRHVTGQAGAA